MQFKVNVNEQVKVKLTDLGISIMKEKRNELNKLFYTEGLDELEEYEPITDKDGYVTFQLWMLMNIFGEYMKTGRQTPFETNIIITKGERINYE